MKRFLTGLLILTSAACSSSGTEVDAEASAAIAAALASGPIEITLEAGEYKRVAGEQLGVKFTRVLEDSRCPIDAVCVWAGNAQVEIELSAPGSRTGKILLNSPGQPGSATWNGVEITLLELQPAPRASEPTRPSAYSVRLRVEKAS